MDNKVDIFLSYISCYCWTSWNTFLQQEYFRWEWKNTNTLAKCSQTDPELYSYIFRRFQLNIFLWTISLLKKYVWISCLVLLMIFCLFHFHRKMKLRKGNTRLEFIYLLFLRADEWFISCKGCIDFKRNLTDGNLIRKCV